MPGECIAPVGIHRQEEPRCTPQLVKVDDVTYLVIVGVYQSDVLPHGYILMIGWRSGKLTAKVRG